MSVPGRGKRLFVRSFGRRQPHLTQIRKRNGRTVSAAAQSSSSESTFSEPESASREDVYIRSVDRFPFHLLNYGPSITSGNLKVPPDQFRGPPSSPSPNIVAAVHNYVNFGGMHFTSQFNEKFGRDMGDRQINGLGCRLSSQYLKLSAEKNTKPTVMEQYDMMRHIDNLPNWIMYTLKEQLIKPGITGTKTFFEALSEPGDVENVKSMVTPRLYDYLKAEIGQAGDYRPVYELGTKVLDPMLTFEPFILLGNPRIWEYADSYDFHHLTVPFEIFKIRSSRLPPEPFKYATISRVGNIAIAGGWPFVVSPDDFGWKYMWKILKYLPTWYKEEKGERGFDERNPFELARKFNEEMLAATDYPGHDDSLGFIVDLAVTMSVDMRVVKRKEGQEDEVVKRIQSDAQTFIVTLRSNHVTPGWKLNAETVRWYIDDINFTTRTIPWLGNYLPVLHQPPDTKEDDK